MVEQKITLGTHDYTVRPQKVGYLVHKLGPNLQAALAAEFDATNVGVVALAKAREVLAVFIPDLMPAHEFCGYGSRSAMEADSWVDEDDKSPDAPQIEEAFKVASRVNGGEVFNHLKGLAGPKLWEAGRAFLAAKLTEEGGPLSKISISSPTSPSTNGGSGSTSSTTTPPTTTPQASEV